MDGCDIISHHVVPPSVDVEPVFGQIKEARGFRRFLLRGVQKIRGEWRLVCLTHNLLKIWRHARASITVEPKR
jgi:hypothetical protein